MLTGPMNVFDSIMHLHRLEVMKEMQQNSHGSYTEITDEKEVMRVSA